jgi:hypothetical protein
VFSEVSGAVGETTERVGTDVVAGLVEVCTDLKDELIADTAKVLVEFCDIKRGARSIDNSRDWCVRGQI